MREDKAGRNWTEKEDHHLVKRWHAGDSQEQIGRALGVTKNTVAGRVNRLRAQGIDIPRRQGGDPALKQKKRRLKTAEAHNTTLNPKVQQELRRHHAKELMRKRAIPSALPASEAADPYLGGETTASYAIGPGATEKSVHAKAPKLGKIPEVEGTTCTTLLMDLKRGQCRYVHGHDAGKRFCDGVAKPGGSMCEAHHALCYRSTARLIDRAAARVAR